MPPTNSKYPGVYVNEMGTTPNAIVPVPTAVPAFIGYTPQAEFEGKSCLNIAQKISSFSDFRSIYCKASPAKQYHPQYYLIENETRPMKGPAIKIKGKHYAILPDPNTIYHLYNCVRMFYQNGGGDAYIVAVGTHGSPSDIPARSAGPIVNPNVKLADLQAGLKLLEKEIEPSLYICPEATLLSVDENGTLMQEMLLQNEKMGSALSIFDIIGGKDPDLSSDTDDIQTFRNQTGSEGLGYGASYYPFVETTTMARNELNYTNLFGGKLEQLAPLLNPDALKVIDTIQNPPENPLTETRYDQALTNASKDYAEIMNLVLKDANTLPPSGAVAGVYTRNDHDYGVWHAPANVNMVGVIGLPIQISHSQQDTLNVDAVSGKSINAIRDFNGKGILIWGARTLDGNSQDWRYISVRRLLTMIEQSCKAAIRPFVFEPNDANTWTSISLMISNFLTDVWRQGGLLGSTAESAFRVECGLGTSMTSDDILSGIMNVIVFVAVVHPSEFIVLSFSQEMAPP